MFFKIFVKFDIPLTPFMTDSAVNLSSYFLFFCIFRPYQKTYFTPFTKF
ncbi:hypothetical protein CLOM621_07375 [Clostridium sp. M62/1]|nr:hypothetical protein CLOM621_07375 [Clostridium sp. M62/1]